MGKNDSSQKINGKAFALRSQESVAKGIKRIARHQLENAVEELTSHPEPSETVHAVRKRLKRLRAVLRLVREKLGEKVYRRENISFRDAARPLTEVRDAEALIESSQALAKHFGADIGIEAFAAVRKALRTHLRAVRKRVLDKEDALTGVTKALQSAQARVRDWSIKGKGWSSIGGGLKRVYKAGRGAMNAAMTDPTAENMHEWRKQAKYLWHQIEILEPVWPGLMEELADQVHTLTQHLGDHHDLFVLRQTVIADPESYGGDVHLETVVALIDRRQEELKCSAFQLGRRCYQDKPAAFTDRIEGYWKAWRAEGRETKAAAQ
ncbi:MAG: CHAD domain-containing protein [Gemmataceae bacterium]